MARFHTVHNVNEDYDHYRQRKTKESIISKSYLLIVIGLFLLTGAYFLKNYSMGFIGLIVLIAGIYFLRSELSFENKKLFNKYYPTALIVFAIILGVFNYYLIQIASFHPNDKSATPIFNFITFIVVILFGLGLIVIIIRYIKSRKHRKKGIIELGDYESQGHKHRHHKHRHHKHRRH